MRMLSRGAVGVVFFVVASGFGRSQAVYGFGDPGPEEQHYIELINRARANPAAEGARLAATDDPDVLNAYQYFGVDLALMQSEFAALSPAPPLAPHAALMAAARGHSQWMFDNQTQTHTQSNPTKTFVDRLNEAGYPYSTAAENIFAYAKREWHGHAGFQVDWGFGGSGGMQPGRGHRMAIHSANYRELGVGVVAGMNGSVGPQVVTQDFGARQSMPSLATGVAYYDLNGNGFYDPGEGIAGLEVQVSGASYSCLTAAGGGWVVPVPTTAATRTVTFVGPDLSEARALTLPASSNAKADLVLDYRAPLITSSMEATAGKEYRLTFACVGGATSYLWKRWPAAAAPPESCDSTERVTSSTTGTYSILSTSVKHEGAAAFTLKNPTGAMQWIELSGLYHGGGIPALTFQSRLRLSTASETFKVQVREDGAPGWLEVDSQPGGGPAETAFSPRAVDLTAVAGKAFRVRFLLDFSTGSYYTSQSDSIGWLIDAIGFTDVVLLGAETTESLGAATAASFVPEAGAYLMAVAPVIGSRPFPAAFAQLAVSEPSAATFATWAAAIEAQAGLPAGTIASHPEGDHDGDGRNNLLECAFGTSPVLANDDPSHLPAIVTDPDRFIVRYRRDASLADVSVVPELHTGPGGWQPLGAAGTPAGFTDQAVAVDREFEIREASLPWGAAEQAMIRLCVTIE